MVFFLLLLNIISGGYFILTHCGNIVAPGPKMFTYKVLLPPQIGPCDMNSTFPFDIAYHLGHGIFRRNGDQKYGT